MPDMGRAKVGTEDGLDWRRRIRQMHSGNARAGAEIAHESELSQCSRSWQGAITHEVGEENDSVGYNANRLGS